MDDVTHCERCRKPSHETNDLGFCSECFTPAEVQEILMEVALDFASGRAFEEVSDEASAHLGRDLTTEERQQLLSLVGDALGHIEEAS